MNNTAYVSTLTEKVVAALVTVVKHGTPTQDLVKPLLLKIIEIVQQFSDGLPQPLAGSDKQKLALAIAEATIEELRKQQVIPQEVADTLLLSVRFAGPALIDGLKALYVKLREVHADIAASGCAGCCKRNF